MHRLSTHRILPPLKVTLALFGALVVALPNCVAAQQPPSVPSSTTRVASRTETEQSRLLVDLRLYFVPCDLLP